MVTEFAYAYLKMADGYQIQESWYPGVSLPCLTRSIASIARSFLSLEASHYHFKQIL